VKKCTKCGKKLSLDSFYKKYENVLRSACKNCTNRMARENYPLFKGKRNINMRKHYEENKKQYQITHAIYRRSENGKEKNNKARLRFLATEEGRESMRKSYKKWTANNKEKIKTHWVVQSALRSKKIKRQSCELCREIKSEAHHEDYSKPLDITWLCRDHHKERHRTVILQ